MRQVRLMLCVLMVKIVLRCDGPHKNVQEGNFNMIIALRAALALMGLLFVYLGITFLIDPVEAGAGFGISPNGNQGLATIRGDFPAFFWVSGGAFLLGAWKRNGPVLLVTVALMGIVLATRFVSLAMDGPFEGYILPMAVEAIAVVLGLLGARTLPEKG